MTPPAPGDYTSVRAAILALLARPEYDDGSVGPVLVRLAWHSASSYDASTNTGGSNGAGMRYEAEGGDPANAGLQHARVFLEPVKAAHPWLTYADLWTLVGCVAIEALGGPAVAWLPGRTDYVDDTRLPPRGGLPDASQGAAHVRAVLVRMGLSDHKAVALCGAHSLRRCHGKRSGFEGKWVYNPTRFGNQYFRLLARFEWAPKTLGSGVRQFVHVDEELRKELMMLPSDMALLADERFKEWVVRYAEDKELFYADFAKAFAKLMELGLRRGEDGKVLNEDNQKGGYASAPKKLDGLGLPGVANEEAEPLREENEKFRARL
ncbi:cytochrome c peroxidase [Mytilinidion resinicola]|uniref:Peroxidase n=1 Tax=Mytilinidion resinicola TaxID=574789 RepID=A0A6A6YV15_9PEZI|nr:cytochrome c peroxidase [Mytilinidion resinicola]KAF2812610.1 cytochrome c peroxidase [Mytilinidion resinicola]